MAREADNLVNPNVVNVEEPYVFSISHLGLSSEVLLEVLRDLLAEDKNIQRIAHHYYHRNNLETFHSRLEKIFEKSNLMNAIIGLILFSTSTICPYYSENYRNKSLFLPFMLLLRMIFCVRDFFFHTGECLFYFITWKFELAFFAFIKLLCDVAALIIHAANVLLACVGIIMRSIVTLLFGYQELSLPGEEPTFAPLRGQISFPQEFKSLDKELDEIAYSSIKNNTFFISRQRYLIEEVPYGRCVGTDSVVPTSIEASLVQ